MSVPEFRAQVLAAYGASALEVAELLAYNRNVFDRRSAAGLSFPLADEPHLAAWRRYAEEAATVGVFEALRPRLVQLAFPIQKGRSSSDAYLAATRRGVPIEDLAEATGLSLRRPEALRLLVHPTLAGSVPVLIATEREDFVALVRALTMRNEPGPVPASMGACIVGGLVNWDRVRVLRQRWEAEHPFAGPAGWAAELERIRPQRELYQDRLIVLSAGPYSSVSAASMGRGEAEWQDLSLTIRLEHECTHYFTRRVFASMRNNLLDEVIADYSGIVAAIGEYRADWALHFLGLEDWPAYRTGGRLENYRGAPLLSEGAFTVLKALVKDATQNLERCAATHRVPVGDADARARRLMALAGLSLEELASDEAELLLEEASATEGVL
jgi:hypothetical protein